MPGSHSFAQSEQRDMTIYCVINLGPYTCRSRAQPSRIALTRGKIRLVTLGTEVGAGCELRSGM